MQKIIIHKPSTLEINFKGQNPFVFNLFDTSGGLVFFRVLDGLYKSIRVNLPDAGTYIIKENCSVKICPIRIHLLNVSLPEFQRNEVKPFKIIHNKNLHGTPARNFVKRGIIETGVNFLKYCKHIQQFILLHEIGHFYYQDEDLADLYAAKKFIEMGYNHSTAIYSLTKVLNSQTERNKSRISKLFEELIR